MKLKTQDFIILETIFALIGLIIIIFSKVNYDSANILSLQLEEKYQKLISEKNFKLSHEADNIYKRVFDSPLNSHNLVPSIEGALEKLSKKYGVIIDNIKIKKQDDHPLHTFLFTLKIQAHNDADIYAFLDEIEKIKECFTISNFFQFQKSQKNQRILIEGEYAFEVYTKS